MHPSKGVALQYASVVDVDISLGQQPIAISIIDQSLNYFFDLQMNFLVYKMIKNLWKIIISQTQSNKLILCTII